MTLRSQRYLKCLDFDVGLGVRKTATKLYRVLFGRRTAVFFVFMFFFVQGMGGYAGMNGTIG
jgi:hypothetical protein